jgi:hypothetical protein
MSLPVLDNIRVAAPCTAAWDDMKGGDRVRFCGSCKKDVYNLSAMSRADAEALIAGRNGRLCVRYFQRADGTILLGDCTVGTRQRRRRVALAAGIAAMLGGGVATTALQLSRSIAPTSVALASPSEPASSPVRAVAHEEADPPPPPPQPLMGKVAFHEVKGDLY